MHVGRPAVQISDIPFHLVKLMASAKLATRPLSDTAATNHQPPERGSICFPVICPGLDSSTGLGVA
jgi:hypothetical protein